MSLSTCILTGTEYDQEGNALQDVTITATLITYTDYNDSAGVNMKTVTATSGADGTWTMNLVPNSLLDPVTNYLFVFTYNSQTIRRERKEVPNETTKNYYDI